MYYEDPCWDLGKWLNHINRLHNVVNMRITGVPDPEINFKYAENLLILEDSHLSSFDLHVINQKAFKTFATMIDSPTELVAVRAKAAEFIVNISTLKRHINRFPCATTSVVSCILNSFLEFEENYEEYVKVHPEN